MQFAKGDIVCEKYKVLFPIKDARNAETYRILDEDGSLCFLKLFNPRLIQPNERDADGELRELALARRIHHPGVPQLKSAGQTEINGQLVPYGIFEFVPGETMQDRRRREIAIEPRTAKEWVTQLARTLAHLHSLPETICHNQVDLTNVMLDSRKGGQGNAMLVDLGHARSATPDSDNLLEWRGHNPYFLAPECFEGQFSTASDVFALGALYYQLVFGMPPWNLGMSAYQASHSDMKDQLASARTRPLAFPNLGADLMPMEKDLLVIRKALHPQLEHRFADAGELLSALEGEAQIDASDVAPITRGTQLSTGPIGFDAIAGMDELKDALSDEVLGPLRNPEKYRAYGLTIPNGMLLYGPPGCGKTFISERFAEEAGLEFKKIVPSNLASIYVHGSQEKIGQLFSEARQLAPCILFFDELDALLPKRDGIGVNPGAASEVNEFLAQMNNASEAGVFIMGATNRPHLIDLAVMRTGRLDKKIYVGPPDHAARKAMFILHLSHRPTDVSIDFDELAHRTDKRVSSDIKYIVDEASRAALRKDVDISQSILLAAIDGTKPSVSHEEINRYEAMKASMNSGGEIGSQDRPTIGFQFGKQSQES